MSDESGQGLIRDTRIACGTHGYSFCSCPFETRERLLQLGLVKEGSGATWVPWVDKPTLRMHDS